MLVFIKTIHTIIYVIMAAAVFVTLYCGIFGLTGRLLYFSISLVAIEGIIFLGNKMRCPLTDMAVKYGAGEGQGYAFDSFIPKRISDYTFQFFTSLYVIGIILVILRWQKII